jgi:hypothetical protein
MEKKLQLPYPHIAGSNIAGTIGVVAEQANLPTYNGIIIHGSHKLMVHIERKDVASRDNSKQIALLQIFNGWAAT